MYIPTRWQQRFQNFEKAYLKFSETLNIKNPSDAEEMGLIQSFEFTIELAWKVLKDYLEEKGIIQNNPKDVIRAGYQQGYISNPELWINAIEARNLTSHAYDEEIANKIIKGIREHYFEVIKNLYNFFKKQIDEI